MTALRIALQTACFRRPLKDALRLAARLGADAVELDARSEIPPRQFQGTALRELRFLLDELGLRVAAVGFRTRRGYDVADELERRIDGTKAAMKLAQALGARLVTNQVGRVPAESAGPQWDCLLQSLGEISRYGLHVGATLAAQTCSESGADLARLLDALPAGGVGADLDPGYLIVNGFSPREAIESLGRRIVQVHARDATRDFARRQSVEVPLGRGTGDFPALLAALAEFDYCGYLTIARDVCQRPDEELGAAVEYLRTLTGQARRAL